MLKNLHLNILKHLNFANEKYMKFKDSINVDFMCAYEI